MVCARCVTFVEAQAKSQGGGVHAGQEAGLEAAQVHSHGDGDGVQHLGRGGGQHGGQAGRPSAKVNAGEKGARRREVSHVHDCSAHQRRVQRMIDDNG